jgi:hypothetical protein
VNVEGGGGTDDEEDEEGSPPEVEVLPAEGRVFVETAKKSRNVYALRHLSSLVVRIDRRYASSRTLRSRTI